MRSYLLKVNSNNLKGKLSSGDLVRSLHPRDWEDVEIALPRLGPRLPQSARVNAPAITSGDEVWIWINETGSSCGQGLSARAKVKRASASSLSLTDVEPLQEMDRVGNEQISSNQDKSTLFGYTHSQNRHDAYLLDGQKLAEIFAAISVHSHNHNAESLANREDWWEGELARRASEPPLLRARREAYTRDNQAAFRRRVFMRYGQACLLTEVGIGSALDAAHIVGHKWDHEENGLPLRRDLHGMFDGLLWSVNPETRRVCLSAKLAWIGPLLAYKDIDDLQMSDLIPRPLLRNHWDRFIAGEAE